MLSSSDSQNKKDKSFWEIKTGNIGTIITTHAELFQDFAKLEKIVFVDPHKWYYANQQDPRYKTPDVVAKLAEIWGISVEI
ncbi:TPA: hypothetical protein DEP21_00695 [Patescibacteria group bacterium]|nr:hypothetical protein [Candidatus Gracilibacteria bacterium]